MSKNLGPVCRICRREGEKLYLKGERCFTPKCAIDRRSFPPGQHGRTGSRGGNRSGRESDYLRQLRAKQRARRVYGVLERQFRRYYEVALQRRGLTGLNLLQILESRLDNVVYRLGFATNRAQARVMVTHGHFTVNGRRTDVPSMLLKEGDVIAVRERSRQLAIVLEAAGLPERDVPDYLEVDHSKMTCTFVRQPGLGDVPYAVQMEPNLVIEYYAQN